MPIQDLEYLLFRSLQGLTTEEESRVLEEWADENADNRSVLNRLRNSEDLKSDLKVFFELTETEQGNQRLERIKQYLTQASVEPRVLKRKSLWWPYVAAGVAVFLGIAISYHYAIRTQTPEQIPSVVLVDGNDIESGGNKAQLTWENGQTIDLSGSQEGIVVGGDLRYEDGAAVSDNLLLSTTAETNPQPQKMTLQTPKGGMYRITLPDNTKVWLNADSRLSYPSTFAENERRVELEGEAYFEVSKLVMKTADLQSKNVPFIVSTAKQSVEVLGTQFNLSSYPDEAKTSTTLVEGSVRITNAQSGLTKMLRPGEQSVVLGNLIQTRTVDVASFVAWKNDMFYFEETPLKSALVQIGRWYDVEIEYKDKIPDTYLYGIISRKKSLSHVLAVLAESGDIKFKIETSGAQNKLTVL